MERTLYVPFLNLSFNAGKINSAGLVRAEGVVHGGSSYLACPPFIIPTDGAFTGISESTPQPVIAHVNLAERSESADFTIFVYADDGELYKIVGDEDALSWVIASAGTVASGPGSQAGGFVSFGPHEIFASGRAGDPVQICRDGEASFEDCFTSTDKPKADFVATIGQRLLFASIGNTGTAGTPDPNKSLIWWGATDQARVIGNPDSHPKDNTDFIPLADDYGDITGLASGKTSAVIFKRSAIYLLELTLAGFTTRRVAVGIGCRYGHSITELADDSYFWSTLGPAVVRNGQVLLLGDGIQAMRDIFNESPADPELEVLSAASDIENGLVMWLLKYKSYPYTYALDASNLPTETEGTAVVTYAVLAYNTISNQFSYLFRQQNAAGVQMVDEGDPTTAHSYLPLCLVDRVPWRSTLPLSGVGMLAVEDVSTDAEGPRYPKLFLAGLSGSNFTPTWTMGQNVILETGYIPIPGMHGFVKSVRPIFRSRRAKNIPPFSFSIKTTLTPFGVERQFGPFTYAASADALRNGAIFTSSANVAIGSYFSVQLTIDARQTSPAAYAFLLSEIEGVEVTYAEAGRG